MPLVVFMFGAWILQKQTTCSLGMPFTMVTPPMFKTVTGIVKGGVKVDHVGGSTG